MKFAYYPGCSLHSTAVEYDMSFKSVARRLDLELDEIDDWNCCGASPAHNTNHLLSTALPARIMGLAEKKGIDVVAPCAACYNRLRIAKKEIEDNDFLKKQVDEAIDVEYTGSNEVYSALDVVVNKVGLETVKERVEKPLEGLSVASYYGCLLVRPAEVVAFDDDPENPASMDDLMEVIGADAVDFPFKTECCGASFSVCNTEVMNGMVAKILENAVESGANCIVTACPLCHANLDMRQESAGEARGRRFNIPVYYFTELLGLALGERLEKLGIQKHAVESTQLLRSEGLVS